MLNSKHAFKRLACLVGVLALLVLNAMPVLAYTIPAQTAEFYVNDSADLLSPETESYIIEVNKDLAAQCGAQVVIATVNDLEGASIEEYATDMFRQYGIGDAEEDNGVLILLALEDRLCRVEVGYGLEGALNDGKTGRIQDEYMIPYFKDENWDEGMRNGFDAIMEEIAAEYDIEVTSDTPRVIETDDEEESGVDITILLPALVCGGASVTIGKLRKRILSIIAVIAMTIGSFFLLNSLLGFGVGMSILGAFLTLLAGLICSLAATPATGYVHSYDPYDDDDWRNRRSGGGGWGGGSSGGSWGGGGSSGGGGSTRGF